MSKFSNFERLPRDLYETIDPKAIPPNFLKYISSKKYYEPSCGSGKLIDQLNPYATCVASSDIEPLGVGVRKDAINLTEEDVKDCDLIITNPIYKKNVLLPLLDHWRSLRPTWVLLPADYLHNKYMVDLMQYCSNVVSVGRLYWFENTWETKVAFDYDQLDPKWDKSIEFYDSMKGIKYYSGWLTNDGKPCKTQFVRGTDNYIWACFRKHEMTTVFETRGD